MSVQLFFFLFLFSGYFCFVDARVICIPSGGCNQSSLALFYVVFLSLYRCFAAKEHTVCQRHLYDVIFRVLSWIFLFSGLFVEVRFKNCPEHLTRRTAKVVIPLMRFLRSSFFILLMYSFFIFSFTTARLMPSAFNVLKYLCVLIFSRFGISIPSSIFSFPSFIICIAHFSKLNSILVSSLYILTACIRVSNPFSFFANSLISSMYISWLIFFFIVILLRFEVITPALVDGSLLEF